MATVNLGDQRLNERCKLLLTRMMSQPSASLPVACRGWNETLAAYRFFSNSKVTAEKILEPHASATLQRMSEHKTVLCLQDTTELDYEGKQQTAGLGPLTYENQCGFYLHPTLAVTPDRLCLGVLDAFTWARSKEDYGKKSERKTKSIEEKESMRWIEGYRRVCEAAKALPDTRCVYMADRESDIYELFAEGYQQQHRADWLIRATHDRLIMDDERMSEALICAKELGQIEFDLPASHKRQQKKIRQRLKSVRVTLRVPQRAHPGELEPVEVSVLLAEEIAPPPGETPVTWILLTNLEIVTVQQAIEKILWYLCRWQIEIYFRILKSGCQVEELQLTDMERIRPALSMYMIIAWRVLYLTMLGRECPDLPCDLVFDTKEWHAIYIVSKRAKPPKEVPTLNTMIGMMAEFGGFLGRVCDGEPGPQSVWIGLQRTRDFVLALDANKVAEVSDTYV